MSKSYELKLQMELGVINHVALKMGRLSKIVQEDSVQFSTPLRIGQGA
jgi:hypothetical protein